MSLGAITSVFEILLSHISKKGSLMDFQKGLRIRRAGSISPGEHITDPPLSFLRFVPSSTHILLSRVLLIEKSITDCDWVVS